MSAGSSPRATAWPTILSPTACWLVRSACCRVSAICGLRAASASRSGMICDASGCSQRAGPRSAAAAAGRRARLPVSGSGSALPGDLGDDLQDHLELVAPPAVDRRLADAGPAGHRLDRQPAVADLGQLLHAARVGWPSVMSPRSTAAPRRCTLAIGRHERHYSAATLRLRSAVRSATVVLASIRSRPSRARYDCSGRQSATDGPTRSERHPCPRRRSPTRTPA